MGQRVRETWHKGFGTFWPWRFVEGRAPVLLGAVLNSVWLSSDPQKGSAPWKSQCSPPLLPVQCELLPPGHAQVPSWVWDGDGRAARSQDTAQCVQMRQAESAWAHLSSGNSPWPAWAISHIPCAAGSISLWADVQPLSRIYWWQAHSGKQGQPNLTSIIIASSAVWSSVSFIIKLAAPKRAGESRLCTWNILSWCGLWDLYFS